VSMNDERPLPKPNADTKPFWDGCCQHQLRFQKCRECGHVRWPPSIICPNCHSQNAIWILSSGRGKIYSYVVHHQAYHPAFRDKLPYVVAIVELEEGPHLLTNIIGSAHDHLRCDLPVVVNWEDVTQEISLPKFNLVDRRDE
jgi:uncharacterized OB-fold protein